MAIDIITGFNSSSRESLDKRSGPYDDLATALATLNTNERYVGMKVLIVENSTKDVAGNYIGGDLTEYIFDGGIDDSNLVTRTYLEVDITDLDKYTQAEVDSALSLKADQATTYAKTEVDSALSLKANQATTYTKTEVDAVVSGLIGDAGEALDTLGELATALDDDENFASTITTLINTKADQATTYTKTEVNDALALKADQGTTYAKTEVDDALDLKADQATTYTKTEVDDALSLKANQVTTYTKTEVNDALDLKANQATTYTKTEVDDALDLKANQTEVNDALALKANQATTYAKTEVDDALDLKADQATTYAKTEVDDALALKADQATTYAKTEVDDALALKANQTEVDDALDLKADQVTTYTKTEVDGSLNTKSDIGHTHVEADITELDKYTQNEVDIAIAPKVEFVESKIGAIATVVNSNISEVNGVYYRRETSFDGVPEGEESEGRAVYAKYDSNGLIICHIIGEEDWEYIDSTSTWEYNGTTWFINAGSPRAGGVQYLYVVNADVDLPLSGWKEASDDSTDTATISLADIDNEPPGDLVSKQGVIYQSPLVSSQNVTEIVSLSQADYDNISMPDPSILYVIV